MFVVKCHCSDVSQLNFDLRDQLLWRKRKHFSRVSSLSQRPVKCEAKWCWVWSDLIYNKHMFLILNAAVVEGFLPDSQSSWKHQLFPSSQSCEPNHCTFSPSVCSSSGMETAMLALDVGRVGVLEGVASSGGPSSSSSSSSSEVRLWLLMSSAISSSFCLSCCSSKSTSSHRGTGEVLLGVAGAWRVWEENALKWGQK